MNITPFIAFYFFACGAYIIYRNWRVNQWPFTEGELVKCQIGTTTKALEDFKTIDFVWDFGIAARVEFVYEVNGVEYSGDRLSFSVIHGSAAVGPYLRKQFENIEVLPSGNVKVYYSSSNPKKSTLLKPSIFNWSFGFVCFVIAIFFLGINPIVI